MLNNHNNCLHGSFAVEDRRRQVAALLAQSKTQDEIAGKLGVSVMTVSRDVKVLVEMSNQFIFDLAKSSLAFYYQQCIETIEQVNRRAWQIHSDDTNEEISTKDRLLALKIIIDAAQAKFSLFEKGPELLNAQALDSRVGTLERRNGIVQKQLEQQQYNNNENDMS